MKIIGFVLLVTLCFSALACPGGSTRELKVGKTVVAHLNFGVKSTFEVKSEDVKILDLELFTSNNRHTFRSLVICNQTQHRCDGKTTLSFAKDLYTLSAKNPLVKTRLSYKGKKYIFSSSRFAIARSRTVCGGEDLGTLAE